MSAKPKDAEQRKFLADARAEATYIVFPLLILVATKLYFGGWVDIFIVPDWSLASCIIFGQCTYKVSRAVSMMHGKANHQNFGLYTSRRFSLVVVSLVVYFFMLQEPTWMLGVLQIPLFFYAIFTFLADSVTRDMIEKENRLGN